MTSRRTNPTPPQTPPTHSPNAQPEQREKSYALPTTPLEAQPDRSRVSLKDVGSPETDPRLGHMTETGEIQRYPKLDASGYPYPRPAPEVRPIGNGLFVVLQPTMSAKLAEETVAALREEFGVPVEDQEPPPFTKVYPAGRQPLQLLEALDDTQAQEATGRGAPPTTAEQPLTGLRPKEPTNDPISNFPTPASPSLPAGDDI